MKKITALMIIVSFLTVTLAVFIGPVHIAPSIVVRSIEYGIKSNLNQHLSFSVHLWRIKLSFHPHVHVGRPPSLYVIPWYLRLPRVLLAYFVGMALAGSGVAAQALFRNPMADPYIIGISGGAGIGAALGFIYWPSHVGLSALLSSLISVYVVYMVARVDGRIPVDTLLLSGIAYGFMAGAVTSYLVIELGPRAHLTWMWLMGSFSGTQWAQVGEMFIVSIGGVAFLAWKWRELNLLLFGEESVSMGLDVDLFRKIVILVIAILTSVAVSTSGIIGFVGLMAPHMTRLLVGPNHRHLTVNAALLGGILLVLADLIARTVARPVVIPVGIVTAIMGGPFFLYLLRKHKRGEMAR